MNPNPPKQPQTPDALDAALAQYGSPDALVKAARGRQIKNCQDYFTSRGNVATFSLAIPDWKDLKLFLNEPNTATFNVQSIYEDVLHQVEDAITNQDAVNLLQNLLLLYKAVRRV